MNQRELVRVLNRIVDIVQTIREEALTRDLDAPVEWYACDRLCAISAVVIEALNGKPDAATFGSELLPEDLDDENFPLTIGQTK